MLYRGIKLNRKAFNTQEKKDNLKEQNPKSTALNNIQGCKTQRRLRTHKNH